MSLIFILPAVWLLVLIVGLPQLSESVYTPSLPDIAHDFVCSESLVEFTLSIYLFAFALGTLFWGRLSDQVGRKPCMLVGLLIFILGCIGCYFSTNIYMLLLSRFIQAFGGSVGSVLGQAICRDAFSGAQLGKVFSTVGSALALFPAVGPVVGGFIAQHFGWQNIFLFLVFFGVCLFCLTWKFLPETCSFSSVNQHNIWDISKALFSSPLVVGFGLIVAACNGIAFSYFAEGSFFLIKQLSLSPSFYGVTFVFIAVSTMVGGMASRALHRWYESAKIMVFGLWIILLATTIFSGIIVGHSFDIFYLENFSLVCITIACQMMTMFGVCMATCNALAIALKDFKWCIGTASSLFGFFYYCLISLFTVGMGWLHNGTLLPMPLYFFCIAIFMLGVNKLLIAKNI